MDRKQKSSKTANILLWIAQAFLSATFIWAGLMKLITPEELTFPWAREYPGLVMLTGSIDLLAGIGILGPTLLRILPQLTIYAAYGTVALMFAACIFHLSRGETTAIGFPLFIALLAVFIAWGRQPKPPIVR